MDDLAYGQKTEPTCKRWLQLHLRCGRIELSRPREARLLALAAVAGTHAGAS